MCLHHECIKRTAWTRSEIPDSSFFFWSVPVNIHPALHIRSSTQLHTSMLSLVDSIVLLFPDSKNVDPTVECVLTTVLTLTQSAANCSAADSSPGASLS